MNSCLNNYTSYQNCPFSTNARRKQTSLLSIWVGSGQSFIIPVFRSTDDLRRNRQTRIPHLKCFFSPPAKRDSSSNLNPNIFGALNPENPVSYSHISHMQSHMLLQITSPQPGSNKQNTQVVMLIACMHTNVRGWALSPVVHL